MAFVSLYVESRCNSATDLFNADPQNVLLTGLLQAVTRGVQLRPFYLRGRYPSTGLSIYQSINGTHMLIKLTSLLQIVDKLKQASDNLQQVCDVFCCPAICKLSYYLLTFLSLLYCSNTSSYLCSDPSENIMIMF